MIDRQIPYQLACNIYKPGLECDNAAREIRRLLPAFLKNIRDNVRQGMGSEYKSDWEQRNQFEYTP